MTVDYNYANALNHAQPMPIALAALWRHRTAKALRQWQQYLDEQRLSNETINQQLNHALEQLTKLRYTVAVVAEVSRGKSELINAMLFAQHGKRIIPSGAGRTTMCPTEFFCDEDVAPYLELLPIESRAQPISFAQLSNTPSAWQRFDLNGDDTEVLTLALQKMCARQKVSLTQAQALGFELDSFDNDASSAAIQEAQNSDDEVNDDARAVVEIPMWRYARLNIHHPLLAKGLAILDTPGLNVLGHEPELTHAILPTVDSVMYLLAADVGVSKSDQLAWQSHLSHLPEHSKLGVLNKVDSLDDGFRSALEVNIDILRQMEHCAQALNLPKSQVFAISARQAFIGRAKQDKPLLAKSRLSDLERSLSAQLLEKRQALLKKHALRALTLSYHDARQQLLAEAMQTQAQLDALNSLSTSRDPQQMILTYAAETKKCYTLESTLTLSTTQTIDAQWVAVVQALATHPVQQMFDALINSCHTASTSGLKQQLNATLVSLHGRMSVALLAAQKAMDFAQKTLNKIDRLNQSHLGKQDGLIPKSATKPVSIDQVDALSDVQAESMMDEYLNELSRIGQTSSTYLPALPFLSATQRMRAVQTMLALQQRSELILVDTKRHAKRWFEQMSHALDSALNAHRGLLNKRTDTLERMHLAQQALTHNMSAQGNTLENIDAKIKLLDNRYQALKTTISLDKSASNHAVSQDGSSPDTNTAKKVKPIASAADLRHLVLTPR